MTQRSEPGAQPWPDAPCAGSWHLVTAPHSAGPQAMQCRLVDPFGPVYFDGRGRPFRDGDMVVAGWVYHGELALMQHHDPLGR